MILFSYVFLSVLYSIHFLIFFSISDFVLLILIKRWTGVSVLLSGLCASPKIVNNTVH